MTYGMSPTTGRESFQMYYGCLWTLNKNIFPLCPSISMNIIRCRAGLHRRAFPTTNHRIRRHPRRIFQRVTSDSSQSSHSSHRCWVPVFRVVAFLPIPSSCPSPILPHTTSLSGQSHPPNPVEQHAGESRHRYVRERSPHPTLIHRSMSSVNFLLSLLCSLTTAASVEEGGSPASSLLELCE